MTETYMLDTDVCSYIIKNRPIELKKTFQRHRNDTLCISAVTYAELLYGLEKKPSDKLARDINEFVVLVTIAEWGHTAAQQYAKICHFLTSRGKTIGVLDMQIAAAAMAMNASLVTNNKKHFSVIPGLITVDWLSEQ
jgi:tRNA(fMet)-specific endonuclease VapC